MRLIDADMLKKYIVSKTSDTERFLQYIDEQPTVHIHLLKKLNEEQQKYRWIPCDEQLPKKGERIIVCLEHGFRCEAIMTQKGKYFRYGIENSEIFGQKVIAWMPLPEPYKEE